jgi:hypothetical protein
MSSTGQYQTATTNTGGIYNSNNYGNTWSKNISAPQTQQWTSVAISSSGQYQTATIKYGNGLYISNDYGNTWTQNVNIIIKGWNSYEWSSVAISSSGQYQIAGTRYNGFFISYDYGVNWTTQNSRGFVQVAMSSTGQYQIGLENYDGAIYNSNDYGNTWIQNVSKPGNTRSVAISSSGQYQVTLSNDRSNPGMYISADFGNSWILNKTTPIYSTDISFASYQYITISSSGQYITAISNKITNYDNTTTLGHIYTCKNSLDIGNQINNASDTYGPSLSLSNVSLNLTNLSSSAWEQVQGQDITSYDSIAVSSSGQYQVGINNSGLIVSKDYGNNWIPNNSIIDCNLIAISATAQYQLVAGLNGNKAYVSTDYGNNWTNTFNSNSGGIQQTFVSSSGQYQIVKTRFFYRSIDYGKTWNLISINNNVIWRTIGISSSGQYQTALNFNRNEDVYGGIYNSNDYGNTWTKNIDASNNGWYDYYWTSISISSSGQYQTALSSGRGREDGLGGGIYNSNDYGNSWTQNIDVSNNGWNQKSWLSVAVSSGGQYQTAVTGGGGTYLNGVGPLVYESIYYSNDYGNTWKSTTASVVGGNTMQISISSNGQYQTILGSRNIYTCKNYLDVGPSLTDGTYGSATTIPIIGVNGGCITSINSVSKTFVIDHPTNKEKYLVHACLEGPEAGVYYRGEGEIKDNNSTTITLPNYVSQLAYNFTIQITPIYNGNLNSSNSNYKVSRIVDNKFTVHGENGEFYWIVYGTRNEIITEPNKTDAKVNGSGPYLWIDSNN